MLTVTAKDFGPIIEGTVELKPLTMFVGPSNTGKSYMATLLYLLSICSPVYGRYIWPFDKDFRSPVRVEPLFDIERDLSEETKQAVNSWAKGIDTSSGEYPQFPFGVLPKELQNQTNSELGLVLHSFTEALDEGLGIFFGERWYLNRNLDNHAQIFLEQNKPIFNMSIWADSRVVSPIKSEHSFDIAHQNIVLHPTNLNRIKYGNLDSVDSISIREEYYSQFFFSLLREAVHQLFASFCLESYYLPAGRTGLMQVYREIAGARTGPFPSRANVVGPSGLISDFVRRILVMDKRFRKPSDSSLSESIDFLERSVTKGKIDFEDSPEVPLPEAVYESEWGKFPLSRTSSMVSELAPLILFLKYLVRPGDLVILEEPESHLHPSAQRQMARAIIRLVNAGVKVLITTHSDYLVSQINNLLRASYASDRWLKRAGFERADCLRHEDVSAYAFQWDEEQGGSRVKELEIRKDVGIDEDEFALVANDLYEETVSFQRIRVK